MNQLTVGNIIKNAIELGLKNVASIGIAALLWLVTIWIPYLNVGTTIALIGIVVAMSKGEIVSPFEIFDAKYRRNMGEFFLLIGFIGIGVMAGYAFFIIPGIVIAIAWSQAIYLLIDKNMNPTEAITVSNTMTYGKKWTIFLANFVLMFVLFIAISIIVWLFNHIWGFLGTLVLLAGYWCAVVIMMASSAYIYGELSKTLEPTQE